MDKIIKALGLNKSGRNRMATGGAGTVMSIPNCHSARGGADLQPRWNSRGAALSARQVIAAQQSCTKNMAVWW
jgi:hypothetical protein